MQAWQRPTLTGTRSQLPSAQKSLTSVFGMGTGVTSLPSLPDSYYYTDRRKSVKKKYHIPSKLDNKVYS